MSFIMNMPFRAIGRMSRAFDDEQMSAFMKLVNGENGAAESLVEATRAKYRKKKQP